MDVDAELSLSLSSLLSSLELLSGSCVESVWLERDGDSDFPGLAFLTGDLALGFEAGVRDEIPSSQYMRFRTREEDLPAAFFFPFEDEELESESDEDEDADDVSVSLKAST